MEEETLEMQSDRDTELSRKQSKSLEEGESAKRHKHKHGAEKDRCSGEKRKHRDDKEEKHSRHRHKHHHRHKYHRKHKTESKTDAADNGDSDHDDDRDDNDDSEKEYAQSAEYLNQSLDNFSERLVEVKTPCFEIEGLMLPGPGNQAIGQDEDDEGNLGLYDEDDIGLQDFGAKEGNTSQESFLELRHKSETVQVIDCTTVVRRDEHGSEILDMEKLLHIKQNVEDEEGDEVKNHSMDKEKNVEVGVYEMKRKRRQNVGTEDEKEEGEILEEDEASENNAESEIESGEIKIEKDLMNSKDEMDEISSKRILLMAKGAYCEESLDFRYASNKGALTGEEMLARDAVANNIADFQGMLHISEAYASDRMSGEAALKESKQGLQAFSISETKKIKSNDFNLSEDVTIPEYDNSRQHESFDAQEVASKVRSEEVKPICVKSSCNLKGEREKRAVAHREVRNHKGAHVSPHNNFAGRPHSGSLSPAKYKKSQQRQLFKSTSRDSTENKHQQRGSLSTEPLKENAEPKPSLSLLDSTVRREHNKRRSRSRDSTVRREENKRRSRSRDQLKERDFGRKRSQSRDSERNKHRILHSSERERPRRSVSPERGRHKLRKSLSPKNVRDRHHAQEIRSRSQSRDRLRERLISSNSKFEARSLRSRENSSETRYHRDMYEHHGHSRSTQLKSYSHYEHSWRRRLRDTEINVERRRRSVSREGSHESRHHRDGKDRIRQSRSHNLDPKSSLDRRQRSKSRDIDRNHKGNVQEATRRNPREGSMERSYEDRMDRDRRHHDSRRNKLQQTDRGTHGQSHEKHDPVTKDSSALPVDDENQAEYQERVAFQLAAEEDDDVERIKEESRRRRRAILEKYRQQQKQQKTGNKCESEEVNKHHEAEPEAHISDDDSHSQYMSGIAASDAAIDLTIPNESFCLGKGPLQNGILSVKIQSGTGGLGAGSPKSDKSGENFCDDIFGESPAGVRKVAKGEVLALDTSGLTDNWDDAEGYYCFRIGEILDGRYEVASSHGRGVFSSVVRSRDLRPTKGEPEEVAIKIIRNNELMYKAGQRELVILKKLTGADPDNRRHCVRFLSSFEYRNHLCLVFESLNMNLREILKKFGRNIGINLNAVRAYAKQLFIALKHLRNCGVLHCDIKPDNMLVNEGKNVLKLCDLGSAMFAGENEITPYLVSRFYRAPEIILGLPYDHALDMWSVGCCLYELYSGKVLFPGPTNNDMLRLHIELKGPFPKKMLKKGGFASQHFDQDYNFCAVEEDPVTKKTVKRVLVNVKPKDIATLVAGLGTADEDPKMLVNFKDLLEKIFTLDPDKRITVSQALSHPFISGK